MGETENKEEGRDGGWEEIREEYRQTEIIINAMKELNWFHW